MEQPWLEVIKQAKAKKEQAEKDLDDIVVFAARQGVGWPEIAEILGLTRQGVRHKYIDRVKRTD